MVNILSSVKSQRIVYYIINIIVEDLDKTNIHVITRRLVSMSSEMANKPNVGTARNDLAQKGQTRDVSGVDELLAALALRSFHFC